MITFRNNVYYNSFRGLSREIWLLSLVMLINRSGAMVLPFLSIYLNQELSFSLVQCGIVLGFFGLGSVMGALIGGFLTDKIGFFKVMYISLLLTALAFYGIMFVHNFYLLCGAIFFLSLIADSFRPANLTAIEVFSKKLNLTRSLSLVRLAINLGYAIGPFLGGYVASLMGYQFLFLFNGTAILAGGIAFYLLFKDRKQRVEISDDSPDDQEQPLPWHNKNYLLFLLLFTLTIVVFFQLLYSVPLFFKTEFGFVESEIGILMAMNGLVIAMIEMPLIYKLEHRFLPVAMVILGGILIGIGFLMLGVVNHYLIAAITFTLFITVGEVLSFPFSNTYALSFSRAHNRGKYMGLYTMTFSIAHIISPMSGMYLAHLYSFHVLWYACAGVCIVASLLIMVTKMRKAQVR